MTPQRRPVAGLLAGALAAAPLTRGYWVRWRAFWTTYVITRPPGDRDGLGWRR